MADCETCGGSGEVCGNCNEVADDCDCGEFVKINCKDCDGTGDDGEDDDLDEDDDVEEEDEGDDIVE